MDYIRRVLLEDEQILVRTRLHWLSLLGGMGKEILIVVALIAGYLAVRFLADEKGLYVAVGFGAIAIVVVLSASVDVVRWRSTQFLVTDRRVVSCRGILSKEVLDSSLSKINDVLLRQTWIGRVFDFGTIEILTASDTGINLMSGIARPIEFKQALLKAKAAFEPGPPAGAAAPGTPTATQLLEELAALKSRGMISEAEYQQKRSEILRRM